MRAHPETEHRYAALPLPEVLSTSSRPGMAATVIQSTAASLPAPTVSIVGVYGGMLDNIPMGSAINRALTFRMAQTPVQHYLPKLMQRIEKGEIDPSFVITHRATLDEGLDLYKTFRAKPDGCIKAADEAVQLMEGAAKEKKPHWLAAA
jgi:threonine dehydrogenase-like Zn-dependent dehydrogenase